MKLRQLDEQRWEIEREGGMRVPGLVFASPALMQVLRDDHALTQVANVAHLPGIVRASLAMPDIHWGYGFPIGGVAAVDEEEGVVSPGGVGYDINCGVRLMTTQLLVDEVRPHLSAIAHQLQRDIPAGVGSSHAIGKLTAAEVKRVLRNGARWAVERGFGSAADLERHEEGGCLEWADPDEVGDVALGRGSDQVGTLGSGNHFIEVDRVDEIFDDARAAAFGLFPGQLCVMIHSGSRGLGYQVCDDSLAAMDAAMARYKIAMPDRQLACAPIGSREGRRYLGAMAAAANFAWANRQTMMGLAARALVRVLAISDGDLGAALLWDVCHNIAKREKHRVDGKKRSLVVHRKGATRAFGPGAPELPACYRDVGQPVMIPGDMGRASYVLCGTERAMEETFGSSCHGAGRVLSRKAALRQARGRRIDHELRAQGVEVLAKAVKTLAEEMPEAYKDVSQVVDVMHSAGVTLKVARLKPVAVVKG
jgi:tRNA-splicing ligase RtcB (3'-phosphate/5'-hydroxy nucleic acid ligase)